MRRSFRRGPARLTPGLQLSNGVEFVYKLTITESYDVKHSMLRSGLEADRGRADLAESLREILGNTDGRAVEESSKKELLAHLERPSGHVKADTDPGPYEAWRRGDLDSTLEDALVWPGIAWLRHAYVLWDEGRVQNQADGIFGDAPQEYEDGYAEQEYKEMPQSFAERSKIWQKGGRGYWSKGDTSRVIWSDLEK
jgi:hypothetical protein